MQIGLMMRDSGVYRELARGLQARGHQVATFIHEPPQSPSDYHALATFMRSCTGFDVLHSSIGLAPLALRCFADTPLLVTLAAHLFDDEEILCRQAPEGCYFGAVDAALVIPGLEYLFVGEGPDLMRTYSTAFEHIAAGARREEHRPWGYYQVLSDQKDHKVKRITVWPGKRLSLQMHRRRAEHWVMVTGQAQVTVNERVIDLGPGESVDIPLGAAHRIANPGGVPLTFIEIQSGDYFGEDDIIRLDDDFGRI